MSKKNLYPYQKYLTDEEASESLERNKNRITNLLNHTGDLKCREVNFNNNSMLILYIEPMVDSEKLQDKVIKPLLTVKEGNINQIITVDQIQQTSSMKTIIEGIISGHCALLINSSIISLVNVVATNERSVEEPANEKMLKGSRAGFVESLNTNIYLIRNEVLNYNLTIEYIQIGESMDKRVCLVYLNHLTNEDLIQKVKQRIQSIKIDYVGSSSQILQLIEDQPWSPFPQILDTERVDRAVAQIMEGRVVILASGSSNAIITPVTLASFFQTPEDYNVRWHIASFLRLIRMGCFIISLVLPAIYIAIVSFHYQIIPQELIFPVKSSLENIPFPPFIEAMIMALILEILREASIRLPTQITQTIGVVGGLVIGTAVVEANLVSNMMIIVISVTAISSFVLPFHELGNSIRILGFLMMATASIFGFLGIVWILALTLMHLCKLEIFGTPYFMPIGVQHGSRLKHIFIRSPLHLMDYRSSDTKPTELKQEWNSRGWKNNDEKS